MDTLGSKKEPGVNSKVDRKPLVFTVLLVTLILVAAWIANLYRQPLGPALETSYPVAAAATDLPEPSITPVATDLPVPTSTLEPAPARPAAPVPTKIPAVCGETEAWNILVIGSDAAEENYPQGADLTRVLRVDFPNKKVAVYALSRDLWVDASDLKLADPEVTNTMLGMVYFEARTRSDGTTQQDAMIDAVNAMAKTLSANFALTNDHYIAIKLENIPEMIDAIGGVPINIPTGFTEHNSGIIFKPGEQSLSGEEAAAYARAYIDTDLSRISRNNLLVEALYEKLKDPAIWVKLPELILHFKNSVVTDLSPAQINHLSCLMKEIETDSIVQDGVKVEWTTPGPQGSLLWDKPKVLDRLKELGMIP